MLKIINPNKFKEKHMKPQKGILDDIAGMAGGALSIAGSAKQQIKEEIKSRINELISEMDLVAREDFDRLEAMLVKARQEQEEMKKRIQELEENSKKKQSKENKS